MLVFLLTAFQASVLLIGGMGDKYNFLRARACHFTPFYTTVEVKYTKSVKISKIIKKKPITTGTTNTAWASYLALLFIARMYPSHTSDRFGDDMASLLQVGRLLGHLAKPGMSEDMLINRIMVRWILITEC